MKEKYEPASRVKKSDTFAHNKAVGEKKNNTEIYWFYSKFRQKQIKQLRFDVLDANLTSVCTIR